MKIRNYYSSAVTVTQEDGTIHHVSPGKEVSLPEKDAKRVLKDAPNRFKEAKKPKGDK